MKLSYQKHFGPDGTVYDQRISMTKNEFESLQYAFEAEIAQNLPRRNEYVSTSGYEIFMKKPAITQGFVYLNHTQTRFANLFLKLKLKDRNTYISLVDYAIAPSEKPDEENWLVLTLDYLDELLETYRYNAMKKEIAQLERLIKYLNKTN